MMPLNIPCIVTKASNDGTFFVGDHIRLCENGDIICKEAKGWIDKEYVESATAGMEFEVDREAIEKMKQQSLSLFEALDSI